MGTQNFERIVELADLSNFPRRHLVLQEVCHGGPQDKDGGCQSHLMLRDVAALKTKYPGRVHYLLGRREPELTDYPLMKGGSIWMIAFRMGIKNVFGSEWEQVLLAYKRFIASCPLAICLPSDIFVSHSVPEKVHETGFDTSIFYRPLWPETCTLTAPWANWSGAAIISLKTLRHFADLRASTSFS